MSNKTDFEFNDNINESEPKRKPMAKRLLTSGVHKSGDKMAGSSGTDGTAGPSGAVKRQKRGKQFRDQNAPRMPLNGYVRYLNANRDRAKTANPDKCFADITKLLAAEWSALPAEQKRQYLNEAEKAKELYLKELEEYQRTDAYLEFQQKQKQRKELKQQKNSSNDPNSGKQTTVMTGSNVHNINANDENQGLESFPMETNASTLDLPIFTEEFLDHNRVREQELRSLRKLNTIYEEQNATLSKHIDNMKSAIEKLEVEAVQQKNNNQALGQHLQHLRSTLLKSFAGIPIPGTTETPNADNIDEYLKKLHSKLTAKDKSREVEALVDRVRAIVSSFDYTLH